MKKTKLVIDYAFDFSLIGVISTARGYKLAWELNQQFGVNLLRQADLQVEVRSGLILHYSCFSTPQGVNKLQVFRNKPQEPDFAKYLLIPEFPHFDFIILAAMEELYSDEALLEKIKAMPEIQMCAVIPLNGLKSKVNFLI